jgi:hypothetical protein
VSEEFCDGVKILLKRMESNPEEFKGTDKWVEFVATRHLVKDGYWSQTLTTAELDALKNGMRKIDRELFTERVMATLLHDKDETLQGSYRVTEIDSRYANLSAQGAMSTIIGGTGGGGTMGTGSPYQNSITYPTLSAFAESQPPIKKPTLGEMLKAKLSLL